MPASLLVLLITWLFMYGVAYEVGTHKLAESGWSKRDSFLFASVAWGSVLVALTEGLSVIWAIQQKALQAAWLVVLLVAVLIWAFLRFRRWQREGRFVVEWPSLSPLNWLASNILSALIGGLIVFLVLTLGLIAYMSVPGNFDALGYHLTRVMYWQQQHSVAHFATIYLNEIQLSPFAEFVVLHLQVLTQDDHYFDTVQWFSMLLSTIGVSQIAAKLGGDRLTQLIAALLNISIPMGILQSVSTQNDYVVSGWLVCFVSFGLSLRLATPKNRWYWTVGCGLALGLALLTKATAFVYALPFALLFGFFLLRKLGWRSVKYVAVIGGLVLLLTAGYLWRNIELFGSPTGPSDHYTNELFTPQALVSNVIRNVTINLPNNEPGSPFNFISSDGVGWLRLIYKWVGLSVIDPRISWDSTDNFDNFPNRGGTNEDTAANPVHLLLITLTLVLAFLSPLNRITKWYVVGATGGFLLFNLFLKWQPWHTRLHLPSFVLWSAVIAVVIFGQRQTWRGWLWSSVAPLLIGLIAVNLAFHMDKHSLSSVAAFPTTNRANYYITDDINIPLFKDYAEMVKIITSTGCNKIGMDTDLTGAEYPMWAMLKDAGYRGQLEHILVWGYAARLAVTDFKPCAIVSEHPSYFKDDPSYIEHSYSNGINLYTTLAYTEQPSKTPTGFKLSSGLGVVLKSGWYNFEPEPNIRWMQTPSEMWVYSARDDITATIQLKPYLMNTSQGLGGAGQLRVVVNDQPIADHLSINAYNLSRVELRLKRGYNKVRLELLAGNLPPSPKEPRPLAVAFYPIEIGEQGKKP